jgi:exonuclease III
MGFMIAKAVTQNILQTETINTRICKVRIKGWFRNIIIISAHAPTEDKGGCEKENFYDTLEEMCHKTPKHDMLIVMGDFNAKVGKEAYQKQVAGMHTIHENSMEMEGCWGSLQLGIICLLKEQLTPTNVYIWEHGRYLGPSEKLIRSIMY